MRLGVFACIVVAASFLASCSSAPPKQASVLDASMQITRGMTYQEVLRIAAPYEKQRTFKGAGTALQFCQNDKSRGIRYFITVWLVDDVVYGLTQYDMHAGLLGPSCGVKFREVDWGQAPADVKIKLDID